MSEVYRETLFNFLFNSVKGYDVSHNARKSHEDKLVVEDLLYGEVPFQVWSEMVKRADPKKDGVFFDLGSGTGRIVMASHLLFDFKKSIGVELLKGLYDKSCEIKNKFEEFVKPQILDKVEGREIEFINENIFAIDLSEADLVFMNHPFKDKELFEKLEGKLLKELKPKSKIITTIRTLGNSAFKSLGRQKYEFSWGESKAYFYEV